MKLTIALFAFAACCYGAYRHYSGQETRIAEAMTKETAARVETGRLAGQIVLLETRLTERKKTFDEASVAEPRKALEAARAEASKTKADLEAELETAAKALEAAKNPRPDPEDAAIEASVTEMRTRIIAFETQNKRLGDLVAKEQAAGPSKTPSDKTH